MPRTRAPWLRIFGYSFGECANSLVMNGLFGFGMLYYTEALGLSPALAGFAMSASVFWEAVTEPVMGHVTDHTRSRFGRRHPWILVGGLLMALCFYFIWALPLAMRTQPNLLFGCLLGMNLLLRTALTMFFIPYLALGFETCPGYDDRSRLQAVRQVFNMAANFAGPAMAWSIFFRNSVSADGTIRPGTSVAANFVHMGAAFSVATVFFVLLVLWSTRYTAQPNESGERGQSGTGLRGFWRELLLILCDRNPRWVFIFTFVVCVGMVLVSSLQMYVYVYFMRFSPGEKSVAHGASMIGMAAGAACSAALASRLDKKRAVIVGGVLSIVANGLLAAIFLPAIIPIGTMAAVVAFVILHALYWAGNGIMLPVATAMIGDTAELDHLKTGQNRKGGYSAIFSLMMRLAISFSFLVSGWVLLGIGFSADATGHSAAVAWRLGAATFLVGPCVCVAALFAIFRYPITRRTLQANAG